MEKRKTYFEQVPLAQVKKTAHLKDDVVLRACPVSCAICGEPVKLEPCKIDEDGEAVHDKCYLAKLAKAPNTKSAKISAKQRILP